MATLDRARAWGLTPLLVAFVASSRVRRHSAATYRLARRPTAMLPLAW